MLSEIKLTDWAGDTVEFSVGGGSFFVEIQPGNDALIQLTEDQLEKFVLWATEQLKTQQG